MEVLVSTIDFSIGLALLSLFGATFLSNVLAYFRDRARVLDPITREARELLMRESAAPMPDCPTLSPAHWAQLEAMQPGCIASSCAQCAGDKVGQSGTGAALSRIRSSRASRVIGSSTRPRSRK